MENTCISSDHPLSSRESLSSLAGGVTHFVLSPLAAVCGALMEVIKVRIKMAVLFLKEILKQTETQSEIGKTLQTNAEASGASMRTQGWVEGATMIGGGVLTCVLAAWGCRESKEIKTAQKKANEIDGSCRALAQDSVPGNGSSAVPAEGEGGAPAETLGEGDGDPVPAGGEGGAPAETLGEGDGDPVPAGGDGERVGGMRPKEPKEILEDIKKNGFFDDEGNVRLKNEISQCPRNAEGYEELTQCYHEERTKAQKELTRARSDAINIHNSRVTTGNAVGSALHGGGQTAAGYSKAYQQECQGIEVVGKNAENLVNTVTNSFSNEGQKYINGVDQTIQAVGAISNSNTTTNA